MTKRELVEALAKFPDEAKICVCDPEGDYYYGPYVSRRSDSKRVVIAIEYEDVEDEDEEEDT